MDEWIVVITDEISPLNARKKFEEWKIANPEISKKLDDDDIKIDIIRTIKKKTIIRYSIKNK